MSCVLGKQCYWTKECSIGGGEGTSPPALKALPYPGKHLIVCNSYATKHGPAKRARAVGEVFFYETDMRCEECNGPLRKCKTGDEDCWHCNDCGQQHFLRKPTEEERGDE